MPPRATEAAAELAAACRAVEVWPVKTNAGFLARAAADPDFLRGDIDTGFIERHTARALFRPREPDDVVIAAAQPRCCPGTNAIPGRR